MSDKIEWEKINDEKYTGILINENNQRFIFSVIREFEEEQWVPEIKDENSGLWVCSEDYQVYDTPEEAMNVAINLIPLVYEDVVIADFGRELEKVWKEERNDE